MNHLTVGRVPAGGLVQVNSTAAMPAATRWRSRCATRLPQRLTPGRGGERRLGPDTAHVLDPGTVTIRVPDAYRGSVAALMARPEVLPADTDARRGSSSTERSGTVVIGGAVRLGPAAVAHGNLSVRIRTRFDVSQPAPLSRGGETVVVPNADVDVREQAARLVTLEEGTTLDAVVAALNALGATPRDVIAIMQALKAAGALRAEIVIL